MSKWLRVFDATISGFKSIVFTDRCIIQFDLINLTFERRTTQIESKNCRVILDSRNAFSTSICSDY